MHSVLNYVCVKFWQLAFLFNSQLFISFCISFISLQASFLPSCFLSFANICVFSLCCLLSLERCIKFLSRRSLVFNSGFFPESVTFLHTFLKTHQTSIHNKHTASLWNKNTLLAYLFISYRRGEFLFLTRKLAHNLFIVITQSIPSHHVCNEFKKNICFPVNMVFCLQSTRFTFCHM